MYFLSRAEKTDELTAKGYRLKKVIKRFIEIEKGNYGNITHSGAEEQEGIASRMYRNYPGVFKGNGLKIMMTVKIRTQQSEQAFLKGLPHYPPDKIHKKIPPDSLNDVLRFFKVSPAYRKYKKGPAVSLRMDSLHEDPGMKAAIYNISREFFKSSFLKRLRKEGGFILLKKDKNKKYGIENFADDLYGIYAIVYSMKEDFLEKGPAFDTLGIQVRDAVPLLADFITSTEDFLRHPLSIDADLRFAHAETISPFAVLLGIKTASSPSSSVFSYREHWRPSEVIPLSSNIQWILYSKNDHYLIKVLLNEKEVRLPVHTETYPYYDWEKLKQYYVNKLAFLHYGINDNMHEYLLRLR